VKANESDHAAIGAVLFTFENFWKNLFF